MSVAPSMIHIGSFYHVRPLGYSLLPEHTQLPTVEVRYSSTEPQSSQITVCSSLTLFSMTVLFSNTGLCPSEPEEDPAPVSAPCRLSSQSRGGFVSIAISVAFVLTGLSILNLSTLSSSPLFYFTTSFYLIWWKKSWAT